MLRDVLDRRPDLPPPVPLPETCADFLRRHGVPEDVIRDLAACCYRDWLALGGERVHLLPMPELVEQNGGVRECGENGYVVLAGSLSGDPIAFDPRTGRMVYVSHETLWGYEWERFEECIHPTPLAYGEFWVAAVSDPDFPHDYYEAVRRWPSRGESRPSATDRPTLRLFPNSDSA